MRAIVDRVQQKLGVSQRRACKVLGQSRSTQRYESKLEEQDAELLEEIRVIATAHPRYGYRRVAAILRRRGHQINLKRVHRLWKKAGLQVKRIPKSKRARGHSANSCAKRKAEHPNDIWTYDFLFGRTKYGHKLKILAILDEFTRECLAIVVDTKLSSIQVEVELQRLFDERGIPNGIRSDNGSEFAAELVQEALTEVGAEGLFIAPGSPWENGYVESFNSRLRDECLDREEFRSVFEARVVLEQFRLSYNTERPHSSLGYATPSEFAESWARDNDEGPPSTSDSGLAPHPQHQSKPMGATDAEGEGLK